MLPEFPFTISIRHSGSNNLLEDCLIFSWRSKLVFAPSVSHTELGVEWFGSRLGKADGANVLLQFEGGAHEQQSEVVVVVAGVKVGVFLGLMDNVSEVYQGSITSPVLC